MLLWVAPWLWHDAGFAQKTMAVWALMYYTVVSYSILYYTWPCGLLQLLLCYTILFYTVFCCREPMTVDGLILLCYTAVTTIVHCIVMCCTMLHAPAHTVLLYNILYYAVHRPRTNAILYSSKQ